MKTGTFMDIVGANYDDIKQLYISRSSNSKSFDEDSFNDAFIKCAKKFGNDIITYEDVVKYLWVAYINTKKAASIKDSKIEYCEEYEDIEEEEDYTAESIYNIVMDAITAAYSEEDMMIYSLYKYHKWTKNDLIEAGYDCKNFEIRIKTIHKFVKAYCKKNVKLD